VIFAYESSKMAFVVRLEGLPFRVTKEELVEHFGECAPAKGGADGVHLVLNRDGRASGLGFVELASAEDAASAETSLNKKDIAGHNRYANVVACDAEELQWYLKRKEAAEDEANLKKFRVRMHGLPFRASEYEIARWFEPESKCSDVEVHLNSNGRPSGDATAFFDEEEQADAAMEKDKQEMNGRYINLTKDSSRPLSRAGFFVRMQGLPYRASEQEIKDFFLPDAECVGVRIILNREGRPSGDAIAEFETDEAAETAVASKNREHLGSRFVVLTREDASSGGSGGGHQNGFQNGGGGFHGGRDSGPTAGTPGSNRFVVKMGGLPYRAGVKDILEW